jgi:ABC-type transporter Mla maintaining outer membrane lipid asymmetry ATPase subunit MlaF
MVSTTQLAHKTNRDAVIVIEHLCKKFGSNVVLNDFNLTVYKE